MHAHLWRSWEQMRHDDPASWAGWLDVVDVDVRARRSDIRRFVASGVPRVWAHTVTTRAERDRAVRLGADGVVTDDPRYVSGLTDVYPVSPTVVTVLDPPDPVQVSDRTSARVLVSAESGPVVPEAVVGIKARQLTGRTVARPRPGVSRLQVSAAGIRKGRERVRFTVAAGSGTERRWTHGRAVVHVEVTGEDLQLVPDVATPGRRLRVAVRLLDSAARDYDGPGAERGSGARSVADLTAATVRLQVLRDGQVVHRQRLQGVDTGTAGDGAGTLRFDGWDAPHRGHYTVRLAQRGPVYRHVVVEERVRVG
jgi:hypothetical protein